MIQILANVYTAITWTGTSQRIADSGLAGVLMRAYASNPVTQIGYINYIPTNQFPSLTRFEPGVNYLVYVSADFSLETGTAAPAGAFAAFTGYAPPTTTPAVTAPATGPGFVATAIAAVSIMGGMLVARMEAGLVPYDATNLAHRYINFGVALNAALPGGAVSVQRGGNVTYPGLNLVPDSVLIAGPNGRLVTSTDGLAFSQVVGKAISVDEFIYQVEDITTLFPNI